MTRYFQHTQIISTTVVMTFECPRCSEPALRTCSGCKRVKYCSQECQKTDWRAHIFVCNPTRPITTADHLALAVDNNLVPEDLQTTEDYGFTRAFTTENMSKMLGLYIGLIERLGVSPQKVHRWRVEGRLIQEIKREYNRIPLGYRGGCYPWFLENQWVLDASLAPTVNGVAETQQNMIRAWRFIGGSASDTFDEMQAASSQFPEHKSMPFCLYMTCFLGCHPTPNQKLWLHFGFCASHKSTGGALGVLYRSLMDKCTFDEFCDAYGSSRLIALFDSKGLKAQRLTLPYSSDFEDVMSGYGCKSVWCLKEYVMSSEPELEISVSVDYGFANCRSESEMGILKDVYKRILGAENAKPLELHDAAMKGKLFEYAGGLMPLKQKLKQKLNRLMKNPYPLIDYDL